MNTILSNLIPHRYWIIVTDDDEEIWLESYASRRAARAAIAGVAEAYPDSNIRIERAQS